MKRKRSGGWQREWARMNLSPRHSCSTPRTGEEPECVFICRPVELLWPSQVTVAGVCVRNAAAGLYMSSAKHNLTFCPVAINEAFVWTRFLLLIDNFSTVLWFHFCFFHFF